MTSGLYEKVSADTSAAWRSAGFGGWLAALWAFAALMVAWHFTSVVGDGRGLETMFETPGNAAIMRVVLWLKVWLWAPFLILAPLSHRLMRAVTLVMLLASVVGETAAVVYLLELSPNKVWSIAVFNALIALAFGGYLGFSKRVSLIKASSRPVDARVRRHFSLLVMVAGSVSIAIFGAAQETAVDRVSFLTAYQFIVLLTIVLTIGPWRTIRTGRTALNIHLRRDIGIWAGIAGLAHLFAGTDESMSPSYIATFVAVAGDESMIVLRQQLFTWGTIIGLVIAVFLLLPLTLSSDRSIRRVGKRWWKRLHRASYVVFILTVVHALAFQFLENRVVWLVAFIMAAAVWVAAVQAVAFVAVRRKRRSRQH